jgi:hypothetical protein
MNQTEDDLSQIEKLIQFGATHPQSLRESNPSLKQRSRGDHHQIGLDTDPQEMF